MRITDWRCSSCGAVLLNEATVLNGWIEVRCRKCHHTEHLGALYAERDAVREIRCPIEPHKLAEASSTWQGAVVTYCRRCKEMITLTAKRPAA